MIGLNTLFLCLLFGSRILAEEPICTPKKNETEVLTELGVMETASGGQRVIDCFLLERNVDSSRMNLSETDLEVLWKIVEAEAGGEDQKGKELVANVVLNRVKSPEFPDTVKAVVYQKDAHAVQFSPVADGRIEKVVVSDSTREAVESVLNGKDESEGALYFVARKKADPVGLQWFDNQLDFLFCHGGHEFFK